MWVPDFERFIGGVSVPDFDCDDGDLWIRPDTIGSGDNNEPSSCNRRPSADEPADTF